MVLLHKITWKEFEKIIQIIKDYEPIAMRRSEDNTWFERVISLLSRVRKLPYNIEVDLEKEDLQRIAVIVDMWNAVRPDTTPYDSESDEVSSKLQRAYFKVYKEHVFSKA